MQTNTESTLEAGQFYRRPDRKRPYEIKHVSKHIVSFTVEGQRMPYVVKRAEIEREIERGQLRLVKRAEEEAAPVEPIED